MGGTLLLSGGRCAGRRRTMSTSGESGTGLRHVDACTCASDGWDVKASWQQREATVMVPRQAEQVE